MRRGRVTQLSQMKLGQLFLLCATVLFLLIFLVLPLFLVFSEALKSGLAAYTAAFVESYTLSAIKLTLLTSLIAVPINIVFGLAAAWLLARFKFRGRNLLLSLVDLPLAVSPVIAGLVFVLLYGTHGLLGSFFESLGLKIIFARTGIVLVSTFITAPLIVRELLPLLEEQGSAEEEAALSMGASGWQTFFMVTLPNIKWGLLYGIILCNSRVMGEFGAVSVVSGHIRGLTNTLPLQIEVLYNEYNFVSAFAAASLLTFLSFATIILKSMIEWREERVRAGN